MKITLPTRGRGRLSAAREALYQAELEEFCATIREIASRLGFRVSSRGWCYLLEEHGLNKGDFDTAQRMLNECRKTGRLPLDICAEDGAREAINTELAYAGEDRRSFDEIVAEEVEDIEQAQARAIACIADGYDRKEFWHDQTHYIEMLVEKIDLKELFKPVCRRYCVPLTNSRGWPDINSRAAMMRRFQDMERRDKQCVLLYCGDHDPAGLLISDQLRNMLADLSSAVGWSPDNLIIDRFGLNADFIQNNALSWIDGLETSAGRSLADPKHPDHFKAYVQDYLKAFGARKVEANALVTRPDAGRALCLEAITRYVPESAPDEYEADMADYRESIRQAVLAQLGDAP